MYQRLSIATALALSVGGCTNNLAVTTAQDQCSRPDVIAFLERGLHETPEGNGASLRDISTVPNVSALGSSFALVCHLTIVRSDGITLTGRAAVSTDFQKVAWTSDEDYQKLMEARAAQAQQDRQAQLDKENAEQKRLARCDPKIKAHYEAAISELSNQTAEYWQHSHQNETAQGFSNYADTNRLIFRLHDEELQACSK
jgi:hypothetical protein